MNDSELLKSLAAAKSNLIAERLKALRAPFPENQISKLPKETKAQAAQRKAEQDKGNWPAKCQVCGGLHHPRAVHLDYVGHAAATDRLLDVDPEWSWEPLSLDQRGLPAVDQLGNLWIKLTVCGVTRLGYGTADGKTGGDAMKEIIGDAIRNAGMRFGMALDLWHKGDLHAHLDDEGAPAPAEEPKPKAANQSAPSAASQKDAYAKWEAAIRAQKTLDDLTAFAKANAATVNTWRQDWQEHAREEFAKCRQALTQAADDAEVLREREEAFGLPQTFDGEEAGDENPFEKVA
jgi:hypothetical protein